MDIMEQIKERLSAFENMYDVLRVVDPTNKKTIIIKGDNVEELEETCYSFWEREEFCENCISMRAYTENDTVVKIENKEEKIFIIIAMPLTLGNNKYIVEMLKDISQSQKMLTKPNNSEDFIKHLINEMNKKTIKDEG
jgi:two-component system cell cycle response regulator